MPNEDCPIWGTHARHLPKDADGLLVASPRAGGTYFISGTAVGLVAQLDDASKARLTTFLVDQRLQGIPEPTITSSVVDAAVRSRPLSVASRLDRLLRFLEKATPRLGDRIRLLDGSDRALEALAWSESSTGPEIQWLFQVLGQNGWVSPQIHTSGFDAVVDIGGYERLEAISNRILPLTQGFVAMWFDSSVRDIYDDGIAPAIRDAGYIPMRIDRKEHNNKIDDEIIAEIRRSRFLIADFTYGDGGPRGGVYYEAGFAHGLSIPVIFTVRADLIDRIHFDTRQYGHILWSQPDDLRAQLKNRISATIGDGPKGMRG